MQSQSSLVACFGAQSVVCGCMADRQPLRVPSSPFRLPGACLLLLLGAQGLNIPMGLKALYKTVWEIKQRILVDMAADRGAFIDQSQSFNVHMSDPNFGKLTSLHFYTWKKGLKTGGWRRLTLLGWLGVSVGWRRRDSVEQAAAGCVVLCFQ